MSRIQCPYCRSNDRVAVYCYCYRCDSDLSIPLPTNTEEALAVAVLEGDMDAALALADEVCMSHLAENNYVSRKEIITALMSVLESIYHPPTYVFVNSYVKLLGKLQASGEIPEGFQHVQKAINNAIKNSSKTLPQDGASAGS